MRLSELLRADFEQWTSAAPAGGAARRYRSLCSRSAHARRSAADSRRPRLSGRGHAETGGACGAGTARSGLSVLASSSSAMTKPEYCMFTRNASAARPVARRTLAITRLTLLRITSCLPGGRLPVPVRGLLDQRQSFTRLRSAWAELAQSNTIRSALGAVTPDWSHGEREA
jgi:hypothetical protein